MAIQYDFVMPPGFNQHPRLSGCARPIFAAIVDHAKGWPKPVCR